VLDGAPDDWGGVGAAAEDPGDDFLQPGECGSEDDPCPTIDDPAGDIKALYVGADADFLFLMFTFHHRMDREHLTYELVFVDNSQATDKYYHLQFDHWDQESDQYEVHAHRDHTPVEADPAIQAASWTVFEARVPWNALDSAYDNVYLRVSTKPQGSSGGEAIQQFIDRLDYYLSGGIVQLAASTTGATPP
jgi:hypothetical protein